MVFQAGGVHLTKEPYDPYDCGRTKCRITLDNLSVSSTGTYKCEVSGDAPTFPIVFEASNMTVIGKGLIFSVKFTVNLIDIFSAISAAEN